METATRLKAAPGIAIPTDVQEQIDRGIAKAIAAGASDADAAQGAVLALATAHGAPLPMATKITARDLYRKIAALIRSGAYVPPANASTVA